MIDGVRLRVPVGFAAALALAAYLAAGWVPDRPVLTAITLMPFALLILAAAEADLVGRSARVLHTPALVRLGQWSFSFYLSHALVVSAFVRAAEGRVDGGAARIGVLAAAYAAAIAAAYALFRLVEHPLERRIRHGGTAVPRAEIGSAAARS